MNSIKLSAYKTLVYHEKKEVGLNRIKETLPIPMPIKLRR